MTVTVCVLSQIKISIQILTKQLNRVNYSVWTSVSNHEIPKENTKKIKSTQLITACESPESKTENASQTKKQQLDEKKNWSGKHLRSVELSDMINKAAQRAWLHSDLHVYVCMFQQIVVIFLRFPWLFSVIFIFC